MALGPRSEWLVPHASEKREHMAQRGFSTVLWTVALALGSIAHAQAVGCRSGDGPPAVAISHFPDRLHAFVWRNWEMVSLERMAEVLDTTPDKVREIGLSMGLPPAQESRRSCISSEGTSPSFAETGTSCPMSNCYNCLAGTPRSWRSRFGRTISCGSSSAR